MFFPHLQSFLCTHATPVTQLINLATAVDLQYTYPVATSLESVEFMSLLYAQVPKH